MRCSDLKQHQLVQYYVIAAALPPLSHCCTTP